MIDKKTVDQLRAKRKISKTEFPKLIGMSNTGYNQMWENNSIKVETLHKIAQILQVPVTYFFEPKPVLTSEDDLLYETSLQSRLILCLEKQEQLYERLLAAEVEKVRLLEELRIARLGHSGT